MVRLESELPRGYNMELFYVKGDEYLLSGNRFQSEQVESCWSSATPPHARHGNFWPYLVLLGTVMADIPAKGVKFAMLIL